MAHKTEVIQIKEAGDGLIAYCFRCCDDPSTDSWKALSVNLNDSDHDAAVEAHHRRVQDTHAARQNAVIRAQRLLKHA